MPRPLFLAIFFTKKQKVSPRSVKVNGTRGTHKKLIEGTRWSELKECGGTDRDPCRMSDGTVHYPGHTRKKIKGRRVSRATDGYKFISVLLMQSGRV